MTDEDAETRDALVVELERQIRPLLDQRKYDNPPGYNCCGCSTYDMILDHTIAIVRGEEYRPPYQYDSNREDPP